MNIDLTQDSIDELRKLRLHHWNNLLLFRKKQEQLEFEADACKAASTKETLLGFVKTAKNTANYHLGAVQLLNQFFPLGDYAENDVTTR